MRHAHPPNRQTIESLRDNGMTLAGICSNGHGARDVLVDMAALIDRLGPDITVPDAAKRIICRECRKLVDVHVTPDTPAHNPFERYGAGPRF